MATYQVVELRGRPNWEPADILSEAFKWPSNWPTVTLSEVAVQISPNVFVEQGASVITPSGVDSQYGGVRKRTAKYQGAGFQVGTGPRDLHVGDLLIPKNPNIPPVLIDVSQAGSLVSDGFLAVRFLDQVSAAFAWAAFASKAGQEFRATLSAGQTLSSFQKIADAQIPVPSLADQERVSTAISRIIDRLRNVESEAVTTWWTTANLQEIGWSLALATPNPQQVLSGNPLSSYAEVARGQRVDRSTIERDRKPALLPITNGGVLSGGSRPKWAQASPQAVIASPGDILVASVGDRANARLVEAETIVEQSVYRLRVKSPKRAQKITAFLNSQQGYAERQFLLQGMTIPRVSASDLLQMSLPENLFDTAELDGPLMPLHLELEELLWSN